MAKDFAAQSYQNQKKVNMRWLLAIGILSVLLLLLILLFRQVYHATSLELEAANGSVVMPEPAVIKIAEKEEALPKRKPRFEFYTMLSDEQTPTPHPKFASQSSEDVTLERGDYMLQVASFRSMDQAKRLSLELSQKGFKTTIQTIGGESSKWYRVVLGPYTLKTHAEIAKQNLLSFNYKSILVRKN